MEELSRVGLAKILKGISFKDLYQLSEDIYLLQVDGYEFEITVRDIEADQVIDSNVVFTTEYLESDMNEEEEEEEEILADLDDDFYLLPSLPNEEDEDDDDFYF